MRGEQYYFISRENPGGNVVYFDGDQLSSGFHITPKNQLAYDGITVNKLVLIKPSFVEKVLRRKVKKKLELYLNYIIELLDSDDEGNGSFREILDELSRYKDVIRYRYQKYLGESYVDLMMKKIELLEYELKLKSMKENTHIYHDEYENTRSR